MKKIKISILMPALICLMLSSCNGDPPEGNYDIVFSTIILKVSDNYYRKGETGGHPVLYPETNQYHDGSIYNDFCEIFNRPGYVPEGINSQINATTSAVDGASKTITYNSCSGGLSMNTIYCYAFTNKNLNEQKLSLKIISGPYSNSNYVNGNLYWTRSIQYGEDQSYRVNQNIVQAGAFDAGNASFKPIQTISFIDKIYVNGLLRELQFSMPELANLKIEAIKQ